MTFDELDTLREGWDFEAKLAGGPDGRGVVPDSLWETYSAMANAEGGLILLGAKERPDGSLEVKGLRDVERVERELWNLLQNPQKVSANVLRREDVERVALEGSALLLIRVPKAGRGDRPVHLNGSWERNTFLRVHEGDRRVSAEVARRMMADAIRDRDSGVLEDYTLKDLHPEAVRRYREFFAVRRLEHPFLAQNDEDFLVSIGAARRDRGGEGRVRPTWGGLWMLGQEVAIREALPAWHLSYKELPENPDDPRRWLDRIHPDGTWNANLFEFYLRVIIKLHDGLKVPFALEGGQFRVDETPVHAAVREALVNTLVHADYQGTTGVRVIKRRTGFEFINPGLLLVTPEQVWRGGVSEPRNVALQRLFGFLRLGEREGSGGPTMRRTWRAQSWRAPVIRQDFEHNETHLELSVESLLPEGTVRDLMVRFGELFLRQDELGRVILTTAELEEGVNHARICELSDAHSRDITLKLRELVRQGMLVASGGMRNKVYSPSRGDEDSLTHKEASLIHKEASLTHKEASPAHKEASPAHTDDVVSQVAGSRRTSTAAVREAILKLCRDRFCTVVELARALNRGAPTINTRYVSLMVREGLLTPLHPQSPSHPNQAYRTVEGPS
jgi:ATP-dependent DNA helicase RecG